MAQKPAPVGSATCPNGKTPRLTRIAGHLSIDRSVSGAQRPFVPPTPPDCNCFPTGGRIQFALIVWPARSLPAAGHHTAGPGGLARTAKSGLPTTFRGHRHLRIKRFYGTSENAVRTQIWIAISVYVLVAIIKKKLRLNVSLHTLLQILSLTLFEKLPLKQAVAGVEPIETNPAFHMQLN